MAKPNRQSATGNRQLKRLVPFLLNWFAANARDLPWRRTRDPYAIWVSEIMLQQTQVKTVIPFWNRWMRELPTLEAAAKASPAKIHKLWEGLGYYTRVRNLQKAAGQVVANHGGKFPKRFDDVLALPGIGRYTAGAICSIAFNQAVPILDGNVIRVLTRVFGIEKNPREKETNQLLWRIAAELVIHAKNAKDLSPLRPSRPLREENSCSFLNQSLMELGALVCTPRNPQCRICPARKRCVAFRENRIEQLPNLGERTVATARRFAAFIVERNGRFLVRQRPAGVVNAHLWEFPNVEVSARALPPGALASRRRVVDILLAELAGGTPALPGGFLPRSKKLTPFCTVQHSITRYRITLEAFHVSFGRRSSTTLKISGFRGTRPSAAIGVWKSPAQMRRLAFTAADKKLASLATDCNLSAG